MKFEASTKNVRVGATRAVARKSLQSATTGRPQGSPLRDVLNFKLQFRVFARLQQGRGRTAYWNVCLSGKQCIFPEKHNFLSMYFEGENHQNAMEELGSVHKIFTDILTAHEKNDRLIKNQCTKECTLKCIFKPWFLRHLPCRKTPT